MGEITEEVLAGLRCECCGTPMQKDGSEGAPRKCRPCRGLKPKKRKSKKRKQVW